MFESWLDDSSIASWLEDGALVRTSAVAVKKFAAFAVTAAAISSGSVQATQLSRVSETRPFTGPPNTEVAHSVDEMYGTLIASGASAVLQDDVATLAPAPAEILTFEPGWLNAGLKRLREVRASALPDGAPINPKSVRVARIVSHQFRIETAPSVGIDDEGNVFLHFKNNRAEAYLTIQPQAMHLFCKVAGKPNIYIDDEPFVGQKLPTKIRKQLAELFAS
jgi:hypothetical protein